MLLVSGSLRQSSTNTALLRTAARHVPVGVGCYVYDGLAHLPPFNPDDDRSPLPPAVEELRASIHRATGILFSVPEYAGALPGAFKNLLDWTIGDAEAGSVYDKPVGWLNTSPRGAEGAHGELRTVLTYAHARIVEGACVHLPVTAGMIGDDGLVTGVVTQDLSAVLLALTETRQVLEDA